ncbi:hypothetical protein [Luteipulveratus halotolerans]
MPVFLDEPAWQAWIRPGELSTTDREDMLGMLLPRPSGSLLVC